MTRQLIGLGARSLVSSLLLLIFMGLDFFPGIRTTADAQTAPITASGLNTQVSGPIAVGGKTQFNITGGTRPGGGTNLFHSFGNFNVPNNNIANFLNDSGLPTSNILGRVTGGNLSSIFGTIQTTGFGNANLFLMNPAGFLFGPNATVNVGGMVAFTTADYLRLSDGVRFNAVPNVAADALLSTSPVAAYGFLGSNPGAITVQGSQFTLADGTGISLVGGNITIESGTPDGGTAQPAQLLAPNGKIQLASAASPGEFDAATLQALPNVNGASFTSFGSVSLAPGSNINISGTNTVSIRGGQFVLSVNDAVLSTAQSVGPSETVSLSLNSSIISYNSGSEPGPDVQIIAGNAQLDGAFVQSITTGEGSGGNIVIGGQAISLSNGAQVITTAEGAGNGGMVSVNASKTVSIEGFSALDGSARIASPLLINADTFEPVLASGLYSNSTGIGSGGHINITAPTVSLDNGGTLMTATSGDGAGGNIQVNANTISATSASILFSSSGQNLTTFDIAGNGKGGDITLNASQSILLSGGSLNLFALTTAFTQTLNEGHGGNITVSAPEVFVMDGASLATQTSGAGSGGTISVSASQSLTISGLNADFGVGSTITTSSFGGNGGSIAINAGTILIEDGGSVGTNAAADGAAGNISIATGDIAVHRGLISTGASSSGASGAIDINASGTVSISEPFDPGFPVAVYANQEGSGARGDVHISGHNVTLTNGAEIHSTAAKEAQSGGNVTIEAVDTINISNGGQVRAFGGDGSNPAINISASNVTLNQGTLSSRTNGSQNGGAITVEGNDINVTNGSQILTSAQLGASGNAGSILLQADDIVVSGGSLISSSVSSPTTTGLGGTITLQAQNGLTLTASGTRVLATTEGIGNAGAILLAANNITINDGATVSANTSSSGAAGSITIEGTASPAQSVSINGSGSGISTDTKGTGLGGSININTNALTMTNGAAISASSTGGADAGNINITANNGLSMQNSTITTDASKGAGGGNIKITTSPEATVDMQSSKISASVADGPGGGGNISIDPQYVIMQNSQILATAADGQGGSISITTSLFLPDANSVVSADSGSGLNGTVTIQSPISQAGGKIQPLGKSPLISTALFNQRCAALASGTFSSFTLAGRDTLPAEPGSWLSSPLALTTPSDGNVQQANNEPEAPPLLSLRQIGPSGFLTQSFAVESSGCQS